MAMGRNELRGLRRQAEQAIREAEDGSGSGQLAVATALMYHAELVADAVEPGQTNEVEHLAETPREAVMREDLYRAASAVRQFVESYACYQDDASDPVLFAAYDAASAADGRLDDAGSLLEGRAEPGDNPAPFESCGGDKGYQVAYDLGYAAGKSAVRYKVIAAMEMAADV